DLDELPAAVHVLGINRIFTKESISETNGSQLKAVGFNHFPRLTNQKFCAAPSDVHQQNLFVENWQRLQHPQIDQTRLFEAGDDLHLNSSFSRGSLDEHLLI